MDILTALLRVNETYDRDELEEIASHFLTYSIKHLTVRQMKNVISLNLGPHVEVEYA